MYPKTEEDIRVEDMHNSKPSELRKGRRAHMYNIYLCNHSTPGSSQQTFELGRDMKKERTNASQHCTTYRC